MRDLLAKSEDKSDHVPERELEAIDMSDNRPEQTKDLNFNYRDMNLDDLIKQTPSQVPQYLQNQV